QGPLQGGSDQLSCATKKGRAFPARSGLGTRARPPDGGRILCASDGRRAQPDRPVLEFRMFDDRVLLITGGTGSFGTAVLKRFLASNMREIRIFSRDEKKQDDLRKKYPDSKLKFYIGDVREPRSVAVAMRGVDYCFHAAALKQVPSCEFHPMEAVRTNVLGTENVLAAAIAEGVKRVICLSTDKAVYPINAMGISKAMMEKVMVASSRSLESTDSVI